MTLAPAAPLNGPIVLVDADPTWPALYRTLAAKVRAALGERALDIFHVGSTSVPDLAAKPIIDMILVVADSADEADYVPALEDSGWVLRIREPDWFEHRLFRANQPAANLHVFSAGCEEIGRTLAFRDRLRADDADRRLYEATKRSLAARTWAYTQDYADAKSEVVKAILGRARSA